MNRKILFCLILLSGFIPRTYAGTGNANDGFLCILVVVGSLFLLAALLKGSDYLHRNGRVLMRYARMKYHHARRALFNYFILFLPATISSATTLTRLRWTQPLHQFRN